MTYGFRYHPLCQRGIGDFQVITWILFGQVIARSNIDLLSIKPREQASVKVKAKYTHNYSIREIKKQNDVCKMVTIFQHLMFNRGFQ